MLYNIDYCGLFCWPFLSKDRKEYFKRITFERSLDLIAVLTHWLEMPWEGTSLVVKRKDWHQPAPEIFDHFDDIMLMEKRKFEYYGPQDQLLVFFLGTWI